MSRVKGHPWESLPAPGLKGARAASDKQPRENYREGHRIGVMGFRLKKKIQPLLTECGCREMS